MPEVPRLLLLSQATKVTGGCSPVLTAHQQPPSSFHKLLLCHNRTVGRQPIPPWLWMVLLLRQQPLLLQPLLLLLLLQLRLLLQSYCLTERC
jgi:hypothetical protein